MNAFITLGDRTLGAPDLLALITQYQMLPQLLKEYVMDGATQGIELTPEEQTAALEQFFSQPQFKDEAQRQAWLNYYHMSAEQLSAVALRQVKVEKFKHLTWNAYIETDFLKNKAQLDRFICAILRTKNAELAQELYFRLKEGEQTFADLAPNYSEGPEAKTGGLIGPVVASTMHPKLLQILSSSQPGQLCPPQRLEEWFVIVRLEQYLPAQLDEAIRRQLLERRFQEWLEQQLQTITLSASANPHSS